MKERTTRRDSRGSGADNTTKKYLNKENDIITGKPVTKATSDAGQKAARTGSLLGIKGLRSFKGAETVKSGRKNLNDLGSGVKLNGLAL